VIAYDPRADSHGAPCPLVLLDELLAESHVVSLQRDLPVSVRRLRQFRATVRGRGGFPC
jgi:hypothetical protein